MGSLQGQPLWLPSYQVAMLPCYQVVKKWLGLGVVSSDDDLSNLDLMYCLLAIYGVTRPVSFYCDDDLPFYLLIRERAD